MATKKPRIMVTLEQEKYDVLKRLAALQGTSMSGIVSGLLEVVIEPLEQLADNLEVVMGAEGDLKEGLRDSVDFALAQLELIQKQAFGIHEKFSEDLEKTVCEIKKGKEISE